MISCSIHFTKTSPRIWPVLYHTLRPSVLMCQIDIACDMKLTMPHFLYITYENKRIPIKYLIFFHWMNIKERYIFGYIREGVYSNLHTVVRGFQGAASYLHLFILPLDTFYEFVSSWVYDENKQLSEFKRYTSLFKKF